MLQRLRALATVVAVMLVAISVAAVVTLLSPSSHVARAEVYFRPQATLDASAQARVASYARMVDGRDGVRARALPGSLVVRLTAESGSAGAARAEVEAATGLLQRRAASLEPATRGLAPSVVRPTALTQTSPPWTRNLLLGALVGVVLGLVAAALVPSRRSRRLCSADDVASLVPTWVTGTVPVAGQVAALVRVEDTTAAYPRLADGLRYLDVDVEGTTLVVAPSRPGHDATEVAARLAEHLVAGGKPVVLVDAAFSRPQLGGLLGLSTGTGLVSVLAGEVDLAEAVVVHEPTGVHVLLAGPGVPDPASLASSRAMARTLEDLRRRHTTVLVVADALGTHDVAAVAAGSADGLLLVLREQVDTGRDLLRDVALVESRGARLRGVVLTRLAGLPAVRPKAPDVGTPALVFPQVPEVDDTSRGRRIPVQRAGDVEPTVVWPAEEVDLEEPRASLLDDFLAESEPEVGQGTGPEPDAQPAPTSGPTSGPMPESASGSTSGSSSGSTSGLTWDDDDTQSIWRPRTR